MRLAQPGPEKLSLDAARKLGDVLLLHVLEVGVRRRRELLVKAGAEVIPSRWFRAWRDLGLIREVRLLLAERERGYRGYEVTQVGRALAAAAAKVQEAPEVVVQVGERRFVLRCRRARDGAARSAHGRGGVAA